MHKVNFHTIENLTVPPALIEKALAIPSAKAPSRKKPLLAAAAVFILLIGVALIYGVFVAPTATVWLDSRDSVTITLNSRGRVLSTTHHPELSGKTAEQAVAAIARDMLADGSLDKTENTLLIGYSGRTDRDILTKSAADAFDDCGFDGCIVALSTEDGGRSALTRALNKRNDSDLRRLSVNDLALLLVDGGADDSDITVTGAPSQSAYLGFSAAVAKAMELTSFSENELADASVSYGVYHGRLIYLVRLNAGGKSEVYFINALSGATEEAIKAPSAEIDRAVENALHTPSDDPTPPKPTSDPTIPAATQNTTDTTDDDNPPYELHTESPTANAPEETNAPAQEPTTPESAAYSSVAITMKELIFVVDTPPDSARDVAYDVLFEGQAIEPDGSAQSGGTVAVITDLTRWRAFIGANNAAYTDLSGASLSFSPDADYFKTHFIVASACSIPDASYCTTVTAFKTDGGALYMENSLTYGAAQSGSYACRTLSLYGVSRTDASPDCSLIVY